MSEPKNKPKRHKIKKYKAGRFPIPVIEVTKLLKTIVGNFIRSSANSWDYDDLLEVAWIKALELSDEFTRFKKAKFSTYLCQYVKFELLNYTRSGVNHHNPTMVCHPTGRTSLIRTMHASDPDHQVTPVVEEAMQVNRGESSDDTITKVSLHGLLRVISERDQEILLAYYGVGTQLQDLATKYGVSPERVRQWATIALHKLRIRNKIDITNDEFNRDSFFSNHQYTKKLAKAAKESFYTQAPTNYVIQLFKQHGHGISMQDIREILNRDGYILRDDRFWELRKKAFPKVNFKLRYRKSKI